MQHEWKLSYLFFFLIFILNRKKSEKRKDKIIFIHAARKNHYADLPARNKLRINDIKEIVNAFKNYKDEFGFCHVADKEEIIENGFNLNVPRYVDTADPEKIIDITKTVKEINELESKLSTIKEQVKQDLNDLGMEDLDWKH